MRWILHLSPSFFQLHAEQGLNQIDETECYAKVPYLFNGILNNKKVTKENLRYAIVYKHTLHEVLKFEVQTHAIVGIVMATMEDVIDTRSSDKVVWV